MINGKCHLCFEQEDLQKSHVWPKFAYKQFVADLRNGGRFVDLHERRLTRRQYKRYWMCRDCEQIIGRTEDYAAKFLRAMQQPPQRDHQYDRRLLPFITSISWRSLKFHTVGEHPRAVEGQWDAAQVWRRYLVGKQGGIKSCTQHVFNIIDNPFGLDKMLGGAIPTRSGLVLSQIGPLIIVGILEPEKLTIEETAVWENSRVRAGGGVIKPLLEWRSWRTGKGQAHRHTVTRRFALLLKSFEMSILNQAVNTDWSSGSRSAP
jgi:hypothetical protein